MSACSRSPALAQDDAGKVHADNQFSWGPMQEVAKLFAGIFLTIIPVIAMLKAGAQGPFGAIVSAVTRPDGQPDPAMYFWATAHTEFLPRQRADLPGVLQHRGRRPGRADDHLAPTLAAISAGAVFMGANSYIGNAPNMMVKAIAETAAWPCPASSATWPGPGILIPLFIIMTFIWFKSVHRKKADTPMSKPKILVARAVFPEVIARLEQHFEVESNQADETWSKAQLIERLKGKAGAFTTGGERIDAEVLAACPDLKICANMAVGYNNFDLDAMTAAGVLATNAPDVLTETTADFGFALLMATARRVTESEHYLRAGKWTKWSFDMFAGSDIHGARWASWAWAASGRASPNAAPMASA
jgi:hypothetical protein